MAYPVLDAGSFEMAADHSFDDSRAAARPQVSPGGLFRRFLGIPGRREPWLAAVYFLVQFPIGLAAFIYAVTVVSVGAGTIVVALAGLVLLALFMYSLQPYGELQRWLSNELLGTRIAPLPFGNERGPLWGRERLKARITNTMTWRLFIFIFLQFGLCIAGFVVAVVLLSLPLAFLGAPISVATGGDTWAADSWQESLWLVPLAIPVFFVSFALLWGAGWVAGVINTAFLGTQYAEISDDGPTVVDRARAAAGAWSNPGAPVVLDPGMAESQTVAERAEAGTSEQRESGLMVDVAMRRVRVNGNAVELTPKEFDLLALFAQNPGRPFSRDDLLDRIWRDDYEVTDRTIDTHVQRLRKKLGNQSGVIQTVWGVGYRFERAESAAAATVAEGAEEDAGHGSGW